MHERYYKVPVDAGVVRHRDKISPDAKDSHEIAGVIVNDTHAILVGGFEQAEIDIIEADPDVTVFTKDGAATEVASVDYWREGVAVGS